MDRRHLARLLAVGRIAVGGALLLAPARAGRGWLGAATELPGARVAIRALGVRDLVLGVGTYKALDRDVDAATWVSLGIACDAVDAAATVAALRHLPTGGGLATIAIAGGAAAAGRAALADLQG